jgi:hypothetical protein
MKIKISKSQWEGIGKKAGWMEKADHKFDALQRTYDNMTPEYEDEDEDDRDEDGNKKKNPCKDCPHWKNKRFCGDCPIFN